MKFSKNEFLAKMINFDIGLTSFKSLRSALPVGPGPGTDFIEYAIIKYLED